MTVAIANSRLADLPVSCVPVLDPGFVPAVTWNRVYRAEALATPDRRALDLALVRRDGTAFPLCVVDQDCAGFARELIDSVRRTRNS